MKRLKKLWQRVPKKEEAKDLEEFKGEGFDEAQYYLGDRAVLDGVKDTAILGPDYDWHLGEEESTTQESDRA